MSDRAPSATAGGDGEVPELGRLAWMVFFEPVTLFHLLCAAGVQAPGGGLLAQLLGRRAPSRIYAWRMCLVLALLAPLVSLIVAGAFGAAGIPLPRGLVAGALVSGMASGVAWAVLASLPFGTALSLALPLAGTAGVLLLSSGVVPSEQGWLTALLVGGAPGAAAGMVFGVSRALTVGEPLGLKRGALTSLLFAGMATFMTASGGVAYALMVAGWLLLGFALFCYRLVLWPLEAVIGIALFGLERALGWRTLRWSPVLWHDLSYLPLPLLRAHVELAARSDPGMAGRALARCLVAPGQRRTAHALQRSLRGLLLQEPSGPNAR